MAKSYSHYSSSKRLSAWSQLVAYTCQTCCIGCLVKANCYSIHNTMPEFLF